MENTHTLVPRRNLEYFTPFKFLFQDANALNNLLMATVLNLIPIAGPMVLMGWYCEILQRLCKRHPKPIPKLSFSDFVYFLSRGVAPFVVVLIASLPLSAIIFMLMFAGMIGAAMLIPALSLHEAAQPILMIGFFGFGALCFSLILLCTNVLVSSALLRAELTEDIGKSLEFGKIWTFIQQTWKDFFVAYVIFLPLSVLLTVAGMLCFFVGMYLSVVIIGVAYLHLRWQIYERYLSQGGEAIPIQTKSGPVPSE